MENDDHEFDLPLSANIKDVFVDHFILEWNSHLNKNTITLFLVSPPNNGEQLCYADSNVKPNTSKSSVNCQKVENSGNLKEFEFILDCCDLDILTVEEILQPEQLRISKSLKKKKADIKIQSGMYMKHLNIEGRALEFENQKHFVKIWKPGANCLSDFPKVIRIKYEIKAVGSSFKWTNDQDNNRCGFTIGHWINNRSLFPSQDAPTAMPTWQAIVSVPIGYVVLMTGDKNEEIYDKYCSEESQAYFLFSTVPMPTSTLAVAQGRWSQVNISSTMNTEQICKQYDCLQHGEDCQINFSTETTVPCRLFLPESLREKEKELEYYLPQCLKAVNKILGSHPFQRLDVLIVPPCFDSLGMASPNLLFLSQSVLVGDYSMGSQISHELCHSWFGLLIGPKDWTEEWLSEGFCTYLEDIVHTKTMGWAEEVCDEYIDLRALIKYRTLVNELEHTNEDLQLLRPDHNTPNKYEKYVKNGMNPNKGFLQVHYLKGYFLLRHLEETVGRKQFLNFLKNYVIKYHGELVSSKVVLNLFFSSFPHLSRLSGVTEESIGREWLDCSDLHPAIQKLCEQIKMKNNLVLTVYKEMEKIDLACSQYSKTSYKRRKQDKYVVELSCDQKILLLELLLDRDRLEKDIFMNIKQQYFINTINPEVYHRVCELIVKHKYKDLYYEVEEFLIKHQAMGVYLYGEMTLSGDRQLIEVSRTCFSQLKSEMPEGVFKTVHAMLYGH